MAVYKNISNVDQTFYGVKFKPGEVKEVPGWINSGSVVRCNESDIKKPTKVEPKKSEEKPKDVQPAKKSKDEEAKTDDKKEVKDNKIKEDK